MQEHALLQRMTEYEPAAWTLIPDLGLYMDQVVTYIERQLEPLYGPAAKGLLTPSMINNYVKSGLVQRPLGKKYYREHLAQLMMIITLKPVASMDNIARLIARDGITESYARSRIEAQHSADWYSARCDRTLVNDSTPEVFRGKCLAFLWELGIMKEKP